MNLGVTELLILTVWLAFAIVPIVAIVHAMAHPSSDFDAIGQSRSVWLVLLLVTLVLCGPIGAILGAYYLIKVKPQL